MLRPRMARRAHSGQQYHELALAMGPTELAIETLDYNLQFGSQWLIQSEITNHPQWLINTGPNIETLEWMVPFGAARLVRRAYQRVGSTWVERTPDTRLPQNIFGITAPISQRRLSWAFDQSGRAVVAYEGRGQVFVTRWDPSTGTYVQNVSFAGVDPVVWMDATVTDPVGLPPELRAPFLDGTIRPVYEWLPSNQWLETVIPDSDIIIFYLSPDRLRVEARAQRQLYGTVHVLHTFTAPVIMDKVQSLFGRYQLLVSDHTGVPLPQMLVSAPYIGGLMALITPRHPIAATVVPEHVAYTNQEFPVAITHPIAATVIVETPIVYQRQEVLVTLTHPVTGTVGVETPVIYQHQEVLVTLTHPVTGSISIETPFVYQHQDIPVAVTHPVTGGVHVENIRYQRA